MKIRILPSAIEDLENGFEFYETQAHDLGGYFIKSLFSDIDSLLIYHGIHPIFFENFYRLLSKKFPFAIYYSINKNIIFIHAVLDCRKDPAWTKGRLE